MWFEDEQKKAAYERAYIEKRSQEKPSHTAPSDFKQLMLGGYPYVDQTKWLQRYYHDRTNILCSPDGYGKTTLLSMFRYFYDKNETMDFFSDKEIAQIDPDYQNRMHACDVIYLDFSSFHGTSFEEACTFVSEIMSSAYARLADVLIESLGYASLETYLDILEQKADVETLQGSLGRLIRHYMWHIQRNHTGTDPENTLIVLIDNLVVTEIYAKYYVFGSEMKEFNNHFIRNEIDRQPLLFIQAGDSVVLGSSGKDYGCFQYQDTSDRLR